MERIAFEVGPDFLSRLEEKLSAAFKASNDYSRGWYEPSQQAGARGKMQKEHISTEIYRAALESGLNADMPKTVPSGYCFTKITLPSFIMGGTRVESKHWKNANYAKVMGRLNDKLDPLMPDLFRTERHDLTEEKIFLVVAVAENQLKNNQPEIHFVVPYSSLEGYHFKLSLEEVRQAAQQPATEPMSPVVVLKKRLDEAERGTKEA
ncbi:hypothetical protein [Chromobacterium amazonense]|nr:hypothetical protein [Chromobacterium amazonense]